MVDIRKTRTCEKCSAQIPLDKVKLYPGNNERTLIVCERCLDRLKNAAKTTLSNAPKSVPSPVHNTPRAMMGNNPVPAVPVKKVPVKNVLQPKKVETTLPESYRSIKCTRCNYTFKVDKDRVNVYFKLVCPYCGKDDKLNPPPKKLR